MYSAAVHLVVYPGVKCTGCPGLVSYWIKTSQEIVPNNPPDLDPLTQVLNIAYSDDLTYIIYKHNTYILLLYQLSQIYSLVKKLEFYYRLIIIRDSLESF